MLWYARSMSDTRGLGQSKPNPFSPGFGKAPGRLVGRDDLLFDLGEGLATGPRDERFTSIVMGVRGSGKTAVLNEIEDRAAGEGWAIISLDATSGEGFEEGDVLGRLTTELSHIPNLYPSLGVDESMSAQATERSTAIKLGPLQEQRTETRTHPPMNVRQQLTHLASKAQQNNTSVLLTIDELHTARRDHLRRLANDLQHITSRAELPLAFVGAGLLEMRYTILQDNKMTFLQRCERYDVPPLDYTDAVAGLRYTIEDAYGEITDEALHTAAQAVQGSPYRLQVVGHRAWKLADAPNRSIDEHAVEQAIDIAQDVVKQKIHVPALYDLSVTEREYLAAVVRLKERATNKQIAGLIGKSSSTTRDIHRRLLLAGYLTDKNKPVRLSDLVPARVVRDEMFDTDDEQERSSGLVPSFSVESVSGLPQLRGLTPCHKWMPRSNARCVLPLGHQGACRSKKRSRRR